MLERHRLTPLMIALRVCLLKTRKNQPTSRKKPSTTLYVVSSKEAKPKGAEDITTAASKPTPGLRLAERLRAARTEKGFSLETASQKSKVALRYVCMLEEGRYPMVADPTYLTYFVRRYAASLGLNELEASREFIAETEYSLSSLNTKASAPAETLGADPSNAARRGPAADALTAGARPKFRGPFVLISQLTTRRMPKLGRHSWSGPLSSRRGSHLRPGMFKFYVGPLSLIAAVVMVGPFSPLYVWIDKTLPTVSKTARPVEGSSALLTEVTRAVRLEPDLVAASPALAIASLPPAVQVVAPKVTVPDVSVADGQSLAARRPPRVLPLNQSSTNKASDALREEQLVRLRAAAAAE